MNRRDYYVSPRRVAKNKDVEQYNVLVNFVKQKKIGVGATSLQDFEDFLLLFSALLWELDPHYKNICDRAGGRFPKEIESLPGFNDPKKHNHKVKPIKIDSLNAKVTQLIVKLERKYMSSSHMKPLNDLVSSVCRSVSLYSKYLDEKKKSLRKTAQRRK